MASTLGVSFVVALVRRSAVRVEVGDLRWEAMEEEWWEGT